MYEILRRIRDFPEKVLGRRTAGTAIRPPIGRDGVHIRLAVGCEKVKPFRGDKIIRHANKEAGRPRPLSR